jgi:hypothetical protein
MYPHQSYGQGQTHFQGYQTQAPTQSPAYFPTQTPTFQGPLLDVGASKVVRTTTAPAVSTASLYPVATSSSEGAGSGSGLGAGGGSTPISSFAGGHAAAQALYPDAHSAKPPLYPSSASSSSSHFAAPTPATPSAPAVHVPPSPPFSVVAEQQIVALRRDLDTAQARAVHDADRIAGLTLDLETLKTNYAKQGEALQRALAAQSVSAPQLRKEYDNVCAINTSLEKELGSARAQLDSLMSEWCAERERAALVSAGRALPSSHGGGAEGPALGLEKRSADGTTVGTDVSKTADDSSASAEKIAELTESLSTLQAAYDVLSSQLQNLSSEKFVLQMQCDTLRERLQNPALLGAHHPHPQPQDQTRSETVGTTISTTGAIQSVSDPWPLRVDDPATTSSGAVGRCAVEEEDDEGYYTSASEHKEETSVISAPTKTKASAPPTHAHVQAQAQTPQTATSGAAPAVSKSSTQVLAALPAAPLPGGSSRGKRAK